MVLTIDAGVRRPPHRFASWFVTGIAAVALGLSLSQIAPARGETLDASEVLQECQPLYNALSSRPSLDLETASRMASRSLQTTSKCGYVFAGILRTRGLLRVPGGPQAAHDALTKSQNHLLTGDQGYDLYLKEAIRTGIAQEMNIGPWKANVEANLGALKNLATDYDSFVNSIFSACKQFVVTLDKQKSCVEQDGMPAEFLAQIMKAKNHLAELERDCDSRDQDQPGYASRCENTILNTRHSFLQAQLSKYGDRVEKAKEREKFRNITAACNFRNAEGSNLDARVSAVSACADKLRDPKLESGTIAEIRSDLAKEVRQLDSRLQTTGTILEMDANCTLRERLSAAATLVGETVDNCRYPPPKAMVQLERALQKDTPGARTRFPDFARGFETDCLNKLTELRKLDEEDIDAELDDAKVNAGDYVKSCSKALAGMLVKMNDFGLSQNIAQKVAADDKDTSRVDLVSADDLLWNWNTRGDDRSTIPEAKAPETAAAIRREARLIADITNHRARSIRDYLDKCTSGGQDKPAFTWLKLKTKPKPTLDDAVKYTGDLLNGGLSSLLEPSTKQSVDDAVAEWKRRGKGSCSQPGVVAAVTRPEPRQDTDLRTTQTEEGMGNSGESSPNAQLPAKVERDCMKGGQPTVDIDCIWALEDAYRPNRSNEEFRKVNLIIPVQNEYLVEAVVQRANTLVSWIQNNGCPQRAQGRKLANELQGISKLFDNPSSSRMGREAQALEKCN